MGTKRNGLSRDVIGCYQKWILKRGSLSRDHHWNWSGECTLKLAIVLYEYEYVLDKFLILYFFSIVLYKSRCEKWHYQIRWKKCNLSKCSCKRRGYVRLRMIWLRHRSIGTSSIRIQIIFLIPLEPFRIKIRRSSNSITSKISIELHFAFKHFLRICFQFILRIIMFK